MRGTLIRFACAAAALAAFALGAAYALGDDVISSSPACCSYSAPTFTITGGQVAQFHNGTTGGIYGSVSHSVLANDSQTLRGQPLFKSPITSSGQTASVEGTQYLPPGDYVFHCAIHGPAMSATLHVTGGAPLARPQVALKVASSKLAGVRRTGKLRVRVSDGGSDAKGVRLAGTLAGHRLRGGGAVTVAVGTAQRVTLRLPKAGRKSLAGLRHAKAKVRAKVPFGLPAGARRTLR